MHSDRSRRHHPPHLAERFLRLTVRDADACDGMLGDLREEYAELVEDGVPPSHPGLWFWLAIIGLSGRFLLAPAARAARLTRSPLDAARGSGHMMEVFQDLKGGLRGIFRNPGVSGVVILTLAVSIGAGTSIFSVVNGVLFSPLPVPDQDRLLRVSTRFLPESGYDYEYFTLTLREYFDYAEQNSTLSDLFTLSGGRRILTSEGGEATMIRVMSTTPKRSTASLLLNATPSEISGSFVWILALIN